MGADKDKVPKVLKEVFLLMFQLQQKRTIEGAVFLVEVGK